MRGNWVIGLVEGRVGALQLLFIKFLSIILDIFKCSSENTKCTCLIDLLRNVFVYDISLVTLSGGGATRLFNLKLHNLSDD